MTTPRAHKREGGETGDTLIEVIVAAMLVVLISASTALALTGAFNSAAQSRSKTQAAEVAEQDQQRLRGLSALQLYGLDQTRNVQLDGTTYIVTSTATFLNSSNGSTCGTSGNGAAAYFKVESSVSWSGNKYSTPVAAESVITPPGGGILLAQVVDQTYGLSTGQDANGAGVSGVNVAASGSSYASGSTDSTGCVELADLSAGSYNVTYTDAGYVTETGSALPTTSSSSVTATGTSNPSPNPLMIGLAGTVNASFTTVDKAGSVSNQQANALSWFGNGSSTTMSAYATVTPTSTPATQITTNPLFPFAFNGPSYANNYEIWAGPCQQMEPPSTVDKYQVLPGSTLGQNVKEPALDIFVEVNGSKVAPAAGAVELSFANTSGTSCTPSWYPAIVSNPTTNADGVLAYPGQPFASTATSGSTESASGYTGSYAVCAQASVSGTTRYAVSTGVTNTSFTGPNPTSSGLTLNITSSSPSGSCPNPA